MLKMVNSIKEKVYGVVIKSRINKDQRGGPGLEEVALMLFVGLIIFTKADDFGSAIGSVFDKAITAIKTGLGIV